MPEGVSMFQYGLIGGAATMVEWPRTVNPVLKKRSRFESYHLHQIKQ